ncbi:hypothetical protein CEW81_07155 [Kluyvera genomosp. 3]|uniref:Uncharacterized protein n=1 Tax=Kluyvera genomosp. 3 TaxID=2774055 RepID=A0A248KGN4_9ENTR|nr:hypothetical protein CEW81_07155 [Kluyvera genomosp. 3]
MAISLTTGYDVTITGKRKNGSDTIGVITYQFTINQWISMLNQTTFDVALNACSRSTLMDRSDIINDLYIGSLRGEWAIFLTTLLLQVREPSGQRMIICPSLLRIDTS